MERMLERVRLPFARDGPGRGWGFGARNDRQAPPRADAGLPERGFSRDEEARTWGVPAPAAPKKAPLQLPLPLTAVASRSAANSPHVTSRAATTEGVIKPDFIFPHRRHISQRPPYPSTLINHTPRYPSTRPSASSDNTGSTTLDLKSPSYPEAAHLRPYLSNQHAPFPSSCATLHECCAPRAPARKFGRMGLTKSQRIGILLGIDTAFFLVEIVVGTSCSIHYIRPMLMLYRLCSTFFGPSG
jgi:hypothetical protein